MSHTGSPRNDFVGKNHSMGNLSRNIRTQPTVCKVLKVLRGHSSAMHWCYKRVESTLIRHFSFTFGLGRSANPPGPLRWYVVWQQLQCCSNSSRAPLLHCVGVKSLLLSVLRFAKKPRVFPLALLSTMSLRECISSTWYCQYSHCERYPLLQRVHSSR